MELGEQTRLALCQDVAFQSLGAQQDTVVLSLGSGYLYTCSATTAALLEAVDGRRSLGQIVQLLSGRYDVSTDKLLQDVLAMAGRLLDEHLVRVVE